MNIYLHWSVRRGRVGRVSLTIREARCKFHLRDYRDLELGGGAEREKQNGGRETDWRDGGGRGKETD